MDRGITQTWSEVIGEIRRAERSLPKDDIWAVAAGLKLADLILDLQHLLQPKQRVDLIGIAAAVAQAANNEIMAALHADLVLRKAAGG